MLVILTPNWILSEDRTAHRRPIFKSVGKRRSSDHSLLLPNTNFRHKGDSASPGAPSSSIAPDSDRSHFHRSLAHGSIKDCETFQSTPVDSDIALVCAHFGLYPIFGALSPSPSLSQQTSLYNPILLCITWPWVSSEAVDQLTIKEKRAR